MSEAVQETEAPAIPTEEELAFTPPEQDPYLPRGKDGKFLPKAEAAAEKPAEPEKKPEAEAKPEPEKEEERAPVAKEAAGLKKQRKWISQQREELERLRAEVEADRKETERLRVLRRENPRAVLDELGLSFRELAEEAAKQDGEDPRDRELRELKDRQAEQDAFIKSLKEERLTAAEQAQYDADRSFAAERISSGDYPALAAYGSDESASVIAGDWARQVRAFEAGKGPKPDAATIFQKWEETTIKDFERMAEKLGYVRSASLAASAKSPERVNGSGSAGKARGDQTGATPPATLTNRTATERASPDRKLSKEERLRMAAGRLVVRD